VTALIAAVVIAGALALVAARLAWRRARALPAAGDNRILVPFAGGALDTRVLAAAIRVSQAEHATLVPAYLLVVPLRLPEDAPMASDIARAMPLLEAIEHAAVRAGVPVDSRIEKGRTPTHALQKIWEAERFTRIIAPAPHGRADGFTPKDMTWILTHAPVEALVLRPNPAQPVEPEHNQLRANAKLAAGVAAIMPR
jgi:hypothetical protein